MTQRFTTLESITSLTAADQSALSTLTISPHHLLAVLAPCPTFRRTIPQLRYTYVSLLHAYCFTQKERDRSFEGGFLKQSLRFVRLPGNADRLNSAEDLIIECGVVELNA